ncbi:Calcipressin-domain-containing protein [Pisolithus orientalis]|uniref:Calcipressin-domain-containing protein n=1 Tax=Pisolithus orientalis TaxID=936130 RepID=UPI0022259B6D|nr:Calcipressin-domain-containing protein [Pisolithus orientalis]KAI6009501.1 Calcipressin-domain-containing protein [Pisolithus orientalis]
MLSSPVSIIPPTSRSGPTSPSAVQPTNTLIITQVPRSFFEPVILWALREYFAVYGEIAHWVPISCFSRILLVYNDVESVEQAKANSDPLVIQPVHGQQTILRVYRAEPNPTISPSSPTSEDQFLKPPPLEKNFLISPPGSPPVGWEQIREDPPNSVALAEDLVAALNKLKCREKRGVREVLLEPEDGIGVGVYVEDCDGEDELDDEDKEEDWEYGTPNPSRMHWKPLPTSLPPMPVTLR